MQILLVNDNSAQLNWGSQASPPSLISILTEAMPDSTIRAVPYAWLKHPYRKMRSRLGRRLFREIEWRGIGRILYQYSKTASYFPEVADDFDYWADEWLAGRGGPQGKEFLALAETADIIVYNGENSIYNNTTEGCHGIFLLWLTKTRLGKPSCIVNFTTHLNNVRPIMSGMVKLVFPELDLVAVREPCSLLTLRSLGIKNVELFPDVVFFLQPRNFSRHRVDEWRIRNGLNDQKYFCISGSGLPSSTPKEAWDGEVSALVRELKASGLQAVLVAKDPMCQFLADVAKRTQSIFFGPEHEFHDLWPLFEGASFLVTGHYHYVILGAMVGCPFIPLSANNHKMQGVCEHVGWERTLPFDITMLRGCRGEIIDEAQKLRNNRVNLSAYLLERSSTLQREAKQLGVRVSELIRRV
jgi:polysaccharide pyruvyl transferase WcaK-like protein